MRRLRSPEARAQLEYYYKLGKTNAEIAELCLTSEREVVLALKKMRFPIVPRKRGPIYGLRIYKRLDKKP